MEDIAKEINDLIKNSELYNNYLICKKNLEQNRELIELENRLENLKKKNCKNKNEDLINEYYLLEQKYKGHPLVKEFENLKKDVYELLVSVSDILSFK